MDDILELVGQYIDIGTMHSLALVSRKYKKMIWDNQFPWRGLCCVWSRCKYRVYFTDWRKHFAGLYFTHVKKQWERACRTSLDVAEGQYYQSASREHDLFERRTELIQLCAQKQKIHEERQSNLIQFQSTYDAKTTRFKQEMIQVEQRRLAENMKQINLVEAVIRSEQRAQIVLWKRLSDVQNKYQTRKRLERDFLQFGLSLTRCRENASIRQKRKRSHVN